MAEQIVLHIRLIDDLVFGTAENLSDQFRIGDRPTQLPNGDFFQVDRNDPVRFPMPGRERKGKQDIFLRQCRRQRSCLHIVTHKNNIFRLIRPQGFQSRIQLRIAQNDKNHIVPVIRCQVRHHRNVADRCAEGELILDPQSVLPDFFCPISPGKQGDVLSGAKQIPCQIAP